MKKKTSVLTRIWVRKLCQAHKPVFEGLGYRLEVKKVGKINIGLWRKKSSKSKIKRRKPKRLVWIPGFGDSPATWQIVILGLRRVIKEEFDELVVLDLPGFHGYMGLEDCGSMDDLIGGVYSVLDDLEPKVIFGHSLGGWLTALYTAEKGSQKKRPGLYQGPEMIIVANPSGVFGSAKHRKQWARRFEAVMNSGFEKFREHLFFEEPVWFPLIAWQLDSFFTRKDVLSFMRSIREDHIVEGRLKHLHCKTWVIWGEKDTLSPAVWVSHWLTHLKAHGKLAQGFVIPKMGHSIHIESPLQTITLLNSILRQENPDAKSRKWWKEVTV